MKRSKSHSLEADPRVHPLQIMRMIQLDDSKLTQFQTPFQQQQQLIPQQQQFIPQQQQLNPYPQPQHHPFTMGIMGIVGTATACVGLGMGAAYLVNVQI